MNYKPSAANKPKFVYPWLLLHPNIPQPLHGVNPRIIKGKEWWDQQRRQVYKQNNYCCWACGVHKYDAKYHRWLEAHEVYSFDYPAGRMKLEKISALCHACHNSIHTGRLSMLVLSRKVTPQFEDEIHQHRDEVLKMLTTYEDNKLIDRMERWQWFWIDDCAKWEDWRLVFEGNEYPPLHKDYAAWEAFYNNF